MLEAGDFRADDLLGGDDGLVDEFGACADGVLHVDAELSFVGLRHELGADERRDHEAEGEEADAEDDGDELVAQDGVEGVGVVVAEGVESLLRDACEPGDEAGLLRFALGEHLSAEHRDDGERGRERAEEGERDHVRELLEHDARHALHEDHGQEDGDGGERTGDEGAGDFVGTLPGGFLARQSAVVQSHSVFEHHDGVVDEHADAEREAAERHDVQRESAEVDEREGGDDGERDADGDDERAADVAEEDEEDQDCEEAAGDGGVRHVVDGALDVLGLVGDGDDVEAAGEFLVDLFEFLSDFARYADGVGAGLLVDLDVDAGLAVDADEPRGFLVGVDHLGDVADADRGAVRSDREEEVADLVEVAECADGAEADVERAGLLVAGGRGDVCAAELVQDVGERDAKELRLVDVEQDVDFAVVAAADVGTGDALDALEPVDDAVFKVFLGFRQVHVRAHAQSHDRHGGGVEADEHRAVDVVREHFQRAVDAVADVGDGVVEVGAPGETHDDGAGLLGADGGDLLNAGDGADLAFDRARDELLDLLRGGVVVEGGYGAGGEVDLREEVHGEVLQGDAAQHQGDAGEHRDENRPFDREVG